MQRSIFPLALAMTCLFFHSAESGGSDINRLRRMGTNVFNTSTTNGIQPRIVGGTVASPGAFPFYGMWVFFFQSEGETGVSVWFHFLMLCFLLSNQQIVTFEKLRGWIAMEVVV